MSPIEDYALLGDLHTGALVGKDGERLDDTTWRLLSFEPERLQPGSPIRWA